MRTHKIMDHTGHTTVEFDPSNAVQLGEAMERFKALTESGRAAATRRVGGGDYTVVKRFEDTLDDTLFAPALKGG